MVVDDGIGIDLSVNGKGIDPLAYEEVWKMAETENVDELLLGRGGVKGVHACRYTLMGRVLAAKPANRQALENAFRNIWGQPKGFKIEELEHNTLMRTQLRDFGNDCGNFLSPLNTGGMMINELCVMCNDAPEYVFHALIDYPNLQLLWVNANFDYSSRIFHANILEWLVVEMGEWRDEQLVALAVSIYLAWERRNKKKFANEVVRTKDLWPRVEKIMNEFHVATVTDKRNRMEPMTLVWEKPKYPYMKLNVDAATINGGGGVLGSLLRDEEGCCGVCLWASNES
ncbi:putative ribonuclease H protein At1g65750 family [Senna tora]|uniref:Putative ribonuclease H protein At1g65750 family n=1 Tax=Senna tora TaxID=362788 RepID=A0A835CIQ6_9FABA|nr:putative ribonuclease H protein At1g65750 family [Senna tora]